MKNEGMLVYDHSDRRYHIWYDKNCSYGLHCGDCLEVLIDGKWVSTRMEMAYDVWVLVGVCHGNFSGLRARR